MASLGEVGIVYRIDWLIKGRCTVGKSYCLEICISDSTDSTRGCVVSLYMSQAKDRTLFTITKAHHPNWELDQMNNLFRGGRRELANQRDPRIVPIRRRLARIAPSPPPSFFDTRSPIGTATSGRTLTFDTSSDDDASADTTSVTSTTTSTATTTTTTTSATASSNAIVQSLRTPAVRTVRFTDYFLNGTESESSDEDDDLLRLT